MGEGQLRMRARRRPDLCRGERIHAQFRDAKFLRPLPHGSRLDEDARIRLANNQDPDTLLRATGDGGILKTLSMILYSVASRTAFAQTPNDDLTLTQKMSRGRLTGGTFTP